MILDYIKFPFTQPEINFDTVREIYNHPRARRVCFASHHKHALKRVIGDRWVGKISVPFSESILPIFEEETELQLFYSKQFGNYWRYIENEENFSNISKFIDKYREIVFLRDALSISIALSVNIRDEEYTEIGGLEKKAKYDGCDISKSILCKKCGHVIQTVPFYKICDCICSVPASRKGTKSLPQKIVADIADSIDMENISDKLYWLVDKPQLKDFELERKWPELEKVGLKVDCNLDGKNIILFDDMYQSGITMQFVGMHLQNAGAKRILGIAIVKSQRDYDNR